MTFTDQMGHMLTLPKVPERIISLVPSQSELLYDWGLQERIVGITKFCIHPPAMFCSVEKIGGTKTLKFDKIEALKPDLIIGNKEENEQTQIQQLQQRYPVWMSDIYTLDDALQMMTMLGDITNKKEQAEEMRTKVESDFQQLIPIAPPLSPKTIYLIWRKPYMAAGSYTFIHDMMKKCGFENLVSNQNSSRYPELSETELQQLAPELILLSSEPYPFKEKHIQELQTLCPQAKIVLVDGELFSWYGSRLLKSPEYFKELIKQISGY
jgi:ABC-type Fe3+-hydroxamate transport system substrate-binding protein